MHWKTILLQQQSECSHKMLKYQWFTDSQNLIK